MSIISEQQEYRHLVATLAKDKNVRIDKFYQQRDSFLSDLGPGDSLCIVSQGNNTICEIDDNNVCINGMPVTSRAVSIGVQNLVNNIYNARKYSK